MQGSALDSRMGVAPLGNFKSTSKIVRCPGIFRTADRCVARKGQLVTPLRYSNAVEADTDRLVETAEMRRTLVVAVDDTEDSEMALKWTVNNVYRHGDALHLLHVIPFVHRRSVPSAVIYSPPDDPEVKEKMTESAEMQISERFSPMLNQLGVACKVDIISERSNETIAEAVCEGAVKMGASVVVVAAHKKRWFSSWISGSRSTEVAVKAPIPVIVFHG